MNSCRLRALTRRRARRPPPTTFPFPAAARHVSPATASIPAAAATHRAALAATRASTPPPNPAPAPEPAPREPRAEPLPPPGVGTASTVARSPAISRRAAIAAASPSSRTPAGRGAQEASSNRSDVGDVVGDVIVAPFRARAAKHGNGFRSASSKEGSSRTFSSTAVSTTTCSAATESSSVLAYSRARSAGTSWFTVKTQRFSSSSPRALVSIVSVWNRVPTGSSLPIVPDAAMPRGRPRRR